MKKKTTGSTSGGGRRKRETQRELVRKTSAELAHMDKSDWKRVGALTDEDIDRAIADDPDAAPVLDAAFWRKRGDPRSTAKEEHDHDAGR